MKYYINILLTTLVFILSSTFSFSQEENVNELFVTFSGANYEFWFDKKLTTDGKFGIFNYCRYQLSYLDNNKNDFFGYSIVNFEITKNISLASGGYLTKQGFSPLVTLNIILESNNLFVNILPGIVPNRIPEADIFVFIQYRPKINSKIKLFSQVIAGTNFNIHHHNFSEQNIRVGLDYHSIQFGIGSNNNQTTSFNGNDEQKAVKSTIGIFVRKEF